MTPSIEASTEISHRCDFALLCNARQYRDAVEVGTDQGVFAREFLTRFTGNWLYLVDPYQAFADQNYDRLGDLLTAAVALSPFHGRYRFVRQRSPEAISIVRGAISPEFVYIDGSHDYADVVADISAWWNVLPDHGMLAGHDYDPMHPGVVKAVDEFASSHRLVVRLTHEKESPASWYIYKREPKHLYVRLFKSDESLNPRYAGK